MRETEEGGSALEAVTTPSLDIVFDVLADRRRRYVLYYLHERPDGIASIDEIADHVVALEGDVERSDHRVGIVTSLQHVHLPKLADSGMIEYDARSETVRYRTQPSLEEWLEHARHKELV